MSGENSIFNSTTDFYEMPIKEESLHQINLNSNAKGEDPNSILEGNNDDIKESADDI
nr:11871_t:CDS:2 [Entrophospora candida]